MTYTILGGAGRIARESALDLLQHADCERLVVADLHEDAAWEVADWLDDPRVAATRIDIFDEDDAVAKLRGSSVVLDGTTISINGQSTRVIALAGCHGINLNGFGEEFAHHETFRAAGKLHVPGFGMTPGTTNMLAMRAAASLDKVAIARVSHGAFRPVAFSASITETTTYEYDPDLPSRVVFERGEFKQVKPFARPRDITLPEPYGTHPQYIIPHSETKTLAEALADKGIELIEVRGTWPPKNMLLIRALYEWGILRNDQFSVDGSEHGIMDVLGEYLQQSEEGTTTDLYGYALHVEIEGERDGKKWRHTLTHTHPASDGSVPDWAGLRSYTRNVGIPMSIGAQLIAEGHATGTGVLIPEMVFRPDEVISELARRDILVHESIEQIEAYDFSPSA